MDESRMSLAKEVSERIKKLSKEKGIAVSNALIACGFPPNFVTIMAKRGSMPAADAFIPIADYFGVSVDYLLGHTVPGADQEGAEVLSCLERQLRYHGLINISKDDAQPFLAYMQNQITAYKSIVGQRA
jgi:transcriptional regulator with XRE-family HTH domain